MHKHANRFKRTSRLLNAADYQNVFEQPLRAVDKYFTVLAKANQTNESRLGLAISKKNARRAVDRNRIKRIARENFRIHQGELAGLDFVVMAKFAAVQAENKILMSSLLRHMKTLNREFSMSSDS